MPLSTLGDLVSAGTMLAFIIVSVAVLVLRRTRPDLPRPFRLPLGPTIPLLAAIISLGVLLTLPVETLLRVVIWLLIGLTSTSGTVARAPARSITPAHRRWRDDRARIRPSLRVQGRLRPLGLTGLPGHGPRTIVVMPSFDLDPDMLRRHARTLPSYEERALYMLFLLDARTFGCCSSPRRPCRRRSSTTRSS